MTAARPGCITFLAWRHAKHAFEESLITAMSDTPLNYESMVEGAMRSVVREALQEVSERGLPGDHHFFITFKTGAPEVEMPAYLRAQHPDDITIVLQHQFWNLLVDEVGFSVDLSFGGKREHLYVPFKALVGFVDPTVEFGLQFTRKKGGAAAEPEAGGLLAAPEDAAETPKAATGDGGQTSAGGADKIVSLDQFRKK